MPIYFISGNMNKVKEVQAILPQVEQLGIDLPEIQNMDATVVIKAKLEEASKHQAGEFLVEDLSLYLDCLNGLPGPFIKWFLKTLGAPGLYDLAKKLGNTKATARSIIGYQKDGKIGYQKDGKVEFFEGEMKGELVAPRGDTKFGWDPIFQPEGHTKTYGEMESHEKNSISHRRKALDKLKERLG